MMESKSISGNRWLLPVSLVAVLCVGVGVGIGIGAGIWKDNGNSADTLGLLSESAVCEDGSHADPLITYILSVDEVSITTTSPELSSGGVAIDATIPKQSLPLVMPFLVNDVNNGTLYQNLLNTTAFLEDWATLSALDNASMSEFAMPAAAAAKQCFEDYEMDVEKSVQSTPTNAMVILHEEEGVHHMAHVYNIRDEGDQIVMKMELVTGDNVTISKEGQCHEYQDLSFPHFHHASTCTQLDANWITDVNSLGNTTASQDQGYASDVNQGVGPGGTAANPVDRVQEAASSALRIKVSLTIFFFLAIAPVLLDVEL